MIWFIYSLTSIGIAFLGEKISRNNKLFLFFLAFVISLMTGLSGQVATDHDNYIRIYNEIDSFSYFNDYSFLSIVLSGGAVEPGFSLICLICHFLGFGKVGFFVCLAFITNLLMLITFRKFPRLWLCILLLIVSTHFYSQANLVRQMLVVAGFVYSTKYLQAKTLKKYLICIAILSLFHISAIPLALLSFYCYIKNEQQEKKINYSIFIIWIITFLIAFMGISIGSGDALLNMIMGGTIYGRYTTGDGGLSTGYGLAYIYNVFVAISFYVFSFNKNWNKQYYVYVALFQIGGIVINLAAAAEALVRVALYFTIFQFVILPYMTVQRGAKHKTTLLSNGILLFLVLYYGLYILGYTYIISGDSLLGKKMYSLTDFFN